MKTLRATFLWPIVMIASFIVFTGVVFADSPADPTTNPTGALQQFWDAVAAKKWGLAATVGVMLFVAFARSISPRIHGKFGTWINSTRVSAVLALLSGGGAAVATQLMKGGAFSMQLVVYGFGFGVAAIGGYNAFWDIFFPSDKKSANNTADSAAALAQKQPPTPPPPVRAGMLLPFVLVACAFSACAHLTPDEKAFGAAYGACMEAKGLAAAPGVADEVWGDLNSGTNQATIVSQLEALGAKAGTDAVACAVQAWLGAPTKATKNPAGVAGGNAYLKAHALTERRSQHAALSPPERLGLSTGALGA